MAPKKKSGAPAKGTAAAAAAAAAAADSDPNPNCVPYGIGSKLVVRWSGDGSERLCDVIERNRLDKPRPAYVAVKKAGKGGGGGGGGGGDDSDAAFTPANVSTEARQWTYYVHYHDFNRRMDEWVYFDAVVKPPSGASVQASEVAAQRERDKANAADAPSDDEAESSILGHDANAARGGGSGSMTLGIKRKRPAAAEASQGSSGPSVVADMDHDEHEGMDESSLLEHEQITKVKNIKMVELGRHRIETWYFSPFPKEYYPDGFAECLYFCEFSLNFFKSKADLAYHHAHHQVDCHPPGNEIYRKDNVAMFEVDGADERVYCENLCYFAKLFLDHKTLFYDVEPFLFYVQCELDSDGFHPVGYFSKEKYSDVGYNLACILTFPPYQRRGYGRLLIDFSYSLSIKEEKVGSPEKPLSDMGLVSYRSYWASTLIEVLKDNTNTSLSIMDLSKKTSILSDDIVNTMQYLGLIRYFNGNYVIVAPPDKLAELLLKYTVRGPRVDPEGLHWSPFLTPETKRDKWNISAKRVGNHM